MRKVLDHKIAQVEINATLLTSIASRCRMRSHVIRFPESPPGTIELPQLVIKWFV